MRMRVRMRTLSLAVGGIIAAAAIVAAQGTPAGCAPANGLRFVCGGSGPEDLVAVPGSPWLIASAFGPDGGLFLIDTKAASSRRIFPDAKDANRGHALLLESIA